MVFKGGNNLAEIDALFLFLYDIVKFVGSEGHFVSTGIFVDRFAALIL